MKRVLCGLVLGAAAFAAAPAHATDPIPVGVEPDVVVNDHTIGVGARYTLGNNHDEPVGGARVNRDTGEVCVGLSYQIPFCAGGPID